MSTGVSGIEHLISGLTGDQLAWAGILLTIALAVPGGLVFLKHRHYLKSDVSKALRTLIARSLYAHLSPAVANQFAAVWIKKLASDIGAREASHDAMLARATRLFIEQVFVDCVSSNSDSKPRWLEQTREQHVNSLGETFGRTVSRFRETTSEWKPHKIETAFQLHSAETATPPIKDYFSALRLCDVPEATLGKKDRFLTKLLISRGFVAPLLVLTGILKRLDEDWPRAIKRFDEAIGESPLSEADLKREPRLLLANVQAFEFYCWLLWGPSIQICNCALWSGESQILQYGFGDEGWSMHLVFEDIEKLNSSWRQIERQLAKSGRPYPLALQTALIATPMWGTDRGAATKTQGNGRRALGQKERPAIYEDNASDIGLLLLCETTIMGTEVSRTQAPFYSAYLWIMFEICDPKNKLKWLDQPWRRYLPVFEHANIADGATLLVLKRQLVAKAISLITSFEKMLHDAHRSSDRNTAGANEPDVYFRYVCAIDDPGASPHRLRFSMTDAESERLRALLMHECASDQQRASRLFEPADDGLNSSCHLPQIVQQFYDYNGIAR